MKMRWWLGVIGTVAVVGPAFAQQGTPPPPSCESQLQIAQGYREYARRAYEHDLARLADEVATLRAKVTALEKAATPPAKEPSK